MQRDNLRAVQEGERGEGQPRLGKEQPLDLRAHMAFGVIDPVLLPRRAFERVLECAAHLSMGVGIRPPVSHTPRVYRDEGLEEKFRPLASTPGAVLMDPWQKLDHAAEHAECLAEPGRINEPGIAKERSETALLLDPEVGGCEGCFTLFGERWVTVLVITAAANEYRPLAAHRNCMGPILSASIPANDESRENIREMLPRV